MALVPRHIFKITNCVKFQISKIYRQNFCIRKSYRSHGVWKSGIMSRKNSGDKRNKPNSKYGFTSLCGSLGAGLIHLKEEVDTDSNGNSVVLSKLALAEKALIEGRIIEAEQLLEAALKSSPTVTDGVSRVYDQLACLAYRQGDVKRAEKLLLELLSRVIQQGVSEDDNCVIRFSLKLARVYAQLGEDDRAEIGFRNCVSVQRNKYLKGIKDDETTELWINSLFWYGNYLLGQEKYGEAKHCFETAYSKCSEVKDVQPGQIMVLLYNLGEAAYSRGEYNDALRHLLNAVVVGRACNSNELPSYYTKIGLIYLAKGLGAEAADWCSRGRAGPPLPESNRCLRAAHDLLASTSP